jgi:hypothetical protein
MVRKLIAPWVALVFLGLSGVAFAGPAAKVTLCHLPPGETSNWQTITVSEKALSAHLAHGDLAGSCDANLDTLCSDGNSCTIDHEDGACLPGTDRPPVNCDDSNQCTIDECDPGAGCFYSPKDCNDGINCTVDSCNPIDGTCSNVEIDCGEFGVCVEATGQCSFPCGGVICDPIDQCHDVGTCFVTPAGEAECIDGDPLENGTACDAGDGLGSGACEDGECVPLCANVNCDDGNACTEDSCDPATGECSNIPLSCDDGLDCTEDLCVPENSPGDPCVHTSLCNADPQVCSGGILTSYTAECTDQGCVQSGQSLACSVSTATPQCGIDAAGATAEIAYLPCCADATACNGAGCPDTPVTCSTRASECSDGVLTTFAIGCTAAPAGPGCTNPVATQADCPDTPSTCTGGAASPLVLTTYEPRCNRDGSSCIAPRATVTTCTAPPECVGLVYTVYLATCDANAETCGKTVIQQTDCDADPCIVASCDASSGGCGGDPITECVGSDGCCPPLCSAATDSDCP